VCGLAGAAVTAGTEARSPGKLVANFTWGWGREIAGWGETGVA